MQAVLGYTVVMYGVLGKQLELSLRGLGLVTKHLLKDMVCLESGLPGSPLLKAKSVQTLQCELCIKILYTNIYFTELFNNPRRNGFK